MPPRLGAPRSDQFGCSEPNEAEDPPPAHPSRIPPAGAVSAGHQRRGRSPEEVGDGDAQTAAPGSAHGPSGPVGAAPGDVVLAPEPIEAPGGPVDDVVDGAV